MGSLKLSQYAWLNSNVWDNNPKWKSLPVGTYLGPRLGWPGQSDAVVLKATLDLTNSRKLTSCAVGVKIRVWALESETVKAYLYSTDPTAGSPMTHPDGSLANASISVPATQAEYPNNTFSRTFSFSGLNVTSGSELYIWIERTAADDDWANIQLVLDVDTPTSTSSFTPKPTSLNITPASVTTGSQISISIGNAASSETVQFYYGNTLLGSTTVANGNGTYTCPRSWFTTAGVTAASMQITAKVVNSSVTKTFTLKRPSSISVTPASIVTGAAVTVSIADASSSETVKFYSGDTLLATTTISNGKGTYTCPRSWFTTAGISGNSMSVTVKIDGATPTASFTLKRPSSITASPSSLVTGAAVTLSIADAAASETVRFYSGNTQLAYTTISNGKGTYTCPRSWFTTAGASGNSMTVTVRIDGANPTTTFTLKKPSSLTVSPSSLFANSPVTITIADAASSETVQFYYNTTLLGSTTISKGSGTYTCPKTWFTTAGVTAASMTITAKVSGTNLSTTFTLKYGSISVNPSTVVSGNAAAITIVNAESTETVQFYYNNTLLGSTTVTNGKKNYTCPRSWFTTAGVSGSSMTVTAKLASVNISTTFTLKRPSGLTVSPTILFAKNAVSVSITGAANSETVNFYYNSTLLGSATVSNGSGKATCPKSWFTTAGITNASSMTVTAKVPGTSLSTDFTLKYGSLTVSPSSVATGEQATINIGNAESSETVKLYYNSTLLATLTVTDGNKTATCDKAWFTTAGLTSASSMTVTAKVDGSPLSTTFTVKAGSDMKPVVATATASIVQASAASDFPSTYIAGFSKAKIAATITLPTNATVSSVKLSHPSGTTTMSYNSSTGKYEATTPTLTGNTTYTVTVTDSRGLTGTKTVSVTGVVSYTPPSVAIDMTKTYRCNSSGTKTDGGTYVRVRAVATYQTSGLSGNSLKKFRFYVQENTSSGANLTSGTQSAPVSFVAANSYGTIVIEIQDKLSGVITKTQRFPAQTRNVVLKRSSGGTYVGIGMEPQRSSGKSDLELPEGGAVLIGDFMMGSLTNFHSTSTDGSQFSKNFLSVNTSSKYALANTEAYFAKTSDTGWSNYPSGRTGTWRGIRKVYWITASRIMVMVIEFAPTVGTLWFNQYDGSSWSGWRTIASTT